MKVVHSPSPSTCSDKRTKIDLFKATDSEDIAILRKRIALQESNKILLRIDDRTQVLVRPQDATVEYAEKLRQRYKINYRQSAVGGRKKQQL